MRSTAYRWPSASAPWKDRAAHSAGCWTGYSEAAFEERTTCAKFSRRCFPSTSRRCWDSKIVPLSYSHNTGVSGPEEFKVIVQQEDRGSVHEKHAVWPAGDVRQFATGARLLDVAAQPRAAADGELLHAQREALVLVAFVAPSGRLERGPHLRDELHESGQEGGLGPFLGGGAALRREGVRPGPGDVLERPARHPHGVDQFQWRDPGAPVRVPILRHRQGP